MAALEFLPEDDVPEAMVQAAVHSSSSLSREEGPADATSRKTVDTEVHAAIVDNEGETLDPARRCRTAMTTCERVMSTTSDFDEESATVSLESLRVLMEPEAASALERAHASGSAAVSATTASSSAASSGNKMFSVLPHGPIALDSYCSSFWSFCFPTLYPYGDGVRGDGAQHWTSLFDKPWAKFLLTREDRPHDQSWIVNMEFIAVLFSTIHRRELLRAVRVKVNSASFQSTVHMLFSLKAMDWDSVADTIGEHGSIDSALRSANVRVGMKRLLRSMRLVQARIPCTDGSRHRMQGLMRSLQYWSGFPALFLTLNPADTHHPLTLHFSGHDNAAHLALLPELDTQLH